MKLTHAAPAKCAARLARGEVKRTALNGQLFAYVVACPACGYPAPYLADASGFVEGEMVATSAEHRGRTVAFRAPETLSASTGLLCYGCRGTITIADNDITTVP